MNKFVCASLITAALGGSAQACIGSPTDITGNQIAAVVAAIEHDSSVNYASISEIAVAGDIVTVILKSPIDGYNTRIYQTQDAPDSGLGSKCDLKIAKRLK